MDENAGCRNTHFALVEKRTEHHPLGRMVQIDIIEDDERRFSSQFKGDALQCFGALSVNRLTCCDTPGKGYFVHTGIADDSLSHFPASEDEVKRSFGQTGCVKQVSQTRNAERCQLRRLYD